LTDAKIAIGILGTLAGISLLIALDCRPVGPNFFPPKPAAPEHWSPSASGRVTQGTLNESAMQTWWTSFSDPELTSLVRRALSSNLDLRKAVEKIDEARAQRGFANAERFPQGGVGASVTRSQSSQNAYGNFSGSPIAQSLVGGLSSPQTEYELSANASWETDLFGRIRRNNEAAEANLQVTLADHRDIQVSLTAEVATNYVDYRELQLQCAITQLTIESMATTLDLMKASLTAGEVSRLEVEQAVSEWENARSQMPTQRANLSQAQHRLEFLLGLSPGGLEVELERSRPIPYPPARIAIGIPAEVLRQRPDVREAEQQLAYQTASIGVAMADKYPQLKWSGTIGLESRQTSNLISPASRLFQIGPSLSWNLFDAGRGTQNVKIVTARQAQARTAFDATVLKALHEVENAEVAYDMELGRQERLLSVEAATVRYQEGVSREFGQGESTRLDLMLAQRNVLSVQSQRIHSVAQVSINAIGIYNALGGGWTPSGPAPITK